MHPKVSVCIPTYNYANYIGAAIESVLTQKFEDFELIILDDCSSDNTEEVVGRYLSDPRVSFDRNEHNLGLAGNWNRCLFMARGEYIKYVFADDLLATNDTLGEMVSVLDSHPEVSLVASSRNIIDAQSRVLRVYSCFEKDFIAEGKKIIHKCLYEQHNVIGEPTVVLFRRAQAARGFHEGLKHLLDLEMWFHLLEQGKFAFLNRPLCSFRSHPTQKTIDNVNNRVYLDDYYLILREYLHKPYIRAGRIIKNYWKMDTLYQFWKLQKSGIIDKQEATRRIRHHFPRFFLVYPFYKLIKPLVRLYIFLYKKRLYS